MKHNNLRISHLENKTKITLSFIEYLQQKSTFFFITFLLTQCSKDTSKTMINR
jgi:hypothetical protein